MNGLSIPTKRKRKLKKLARVMNRQNEMPVLLIGQILELLDYDVTDEELDYLLQLGTEVRTSEDIAALWGMDRDECSVLLGRLIRKGFLLPETGSESLEKLQLAPIVVGWLEFQLLAGQDSPKSHDFARRLENLCQAIRKYNIFPTRNLSNLLTRRMLKPYQTIGTIQKVRHKKEGATIQVNRSVDYGRSTVFPIHDAYELVDRHGTNNQVAVVHCFCRRWRKMTDDPCRFDLPFESCMALGPAAEHLSHLGFGKKFQKIDALKLLEEMAKGGAIHTLYHEKDDTGLPNVAVCNCCWDCCGLYGSFNRGLIPLYFRSYYQAKIPDNSLCKSCGLCEKRCPVNAIFLKDSTANIDNKKCIGCGQCSYMCPVGNITLEYNERDVFLPLQKKSDARIV